MDSEAKPILTFDYNKLGPVNTMQISIDGGHFLPGQGAPSAVYLGYVSESATPSWGKWPRPFGLALQRDHSALRIAYLEPPNRAQRALPGLFGGLEDQRWASA